MSIAFLKPTGETDAGSIIASGVLTDVDEGVSAADGNLEVSKTNSWSGSTVVFDMEDLPGDADSINSVILRVRAKTDNGVDDTIFYTWDVLGTEMEGFSVTWIGVTDAGAGLQNRTDTGTGSPTVANVNAAQIRVDQTNFSQLMNPDGTTHSWDCFELEVDYNVADGDVTLVADPGSLTLSGAVANFKQAVEALPAALIFTGAVATFSIGTVLDAQPGALTLAGAEANFTTTLDAQPGALALAGANAEFQIGTTLDAQPGALVLAGADADFIADVTLPADPGALALAGADADFQTGTNLDAQPGALILAGADADFRLIEVIDAQPGALVLAGADADFRLIETLDAQPGALILTGAEADFIIAPPGVLVAQPGALVLAGAEATFSISGGPVIRRRGGRFLVEGEREPEVIEELIALVEPEIVREPAKFTARSPKTAPETTIRPTATIPARKRATVTRLLSEAGITLEELLAIIDL